MGCFYQKCLHNYYGFSPNQLLFGKKTHFPSVLIDKPPALEEKTISDIIANHLNGMHAACIASIEAEASEKLTKVIKAKTRLSTGIIYQILFITVLGTENKQILGSCNSSCMSFTARSKFTNDINE